MAGADKDAERAMGMGTSDPAETEFHRSNLEEYERADDTRPPFMLTSMEAKLLGIAGVSLSSSYHGFVPWHVCGQSCSCCD